MCWGLGAMLYFCNVRAALETGPGGAGNAPKPTSARKAPASATNRPNRTRRLKKADCEVDFFFMRWSFAVGFVETPGAFQRCFTYVPQRSGSGNAFLAECGEMCQHHFFVFYHKKTQIHANNSNAAPTCDKLVFGFLLVLLLIFYHGEPRVKRIMRMTKSE